MVTYSIRPKKQTIKEAEGEAPHHQHQEDQSMGFVENRLKPGLQRKINNTGLPENLESGIAKLSGFSMDDVKVHYNSSKPAQVQAHAYTQGTDIYVAPGQAKHVAHEAWHVAQQKAGIVRPTGQIAGKNVNDDPKLEKEADFMSKKALKV